MSSVRYDGGMEIRFDKIWWPFWLVTNGLVVAILLFAAHVESTDPEGYYRMAQEDEFLEWATFWCFMVAAVAFGWSAALLKRQGTRWPWFFAGLACFCFVVAMEEISWGQRLLGFRPHAYFLANNFQQEFNVHNVMSTDIRKIGLKACILGYGVFLPLLAWLPRARQVLQKVGISEPPRWLIPSFLISFVLYEQYPWKYTGEWVEMVLALAFLFSALATMLILRDDAKPPKAVAVALASSLGLVGALAFGMVFASRQIAAQPEQLAATELETQALAKDFLDPRASTRCRLHKRVYTYVEQYERDYLWEGEFSELIDQGLPEERAQYFLDPWNSPYWVRDYCNKKKTRRVVFVYSFGPNRRRDSSRTEILGDDLGTVILDLGQ